jgi:glycerol uptake facilitator protein
MKFTKGQEFMAEILGTMVLILFGCGVVAMVVLFGATNPPIPGEVVKGGYTNITLGWGLAVTFGIYVAGTISGAHLNPAVTLAMAATKRMPWSKVPHYILAQFIGAFLGAALVFAVYYPKWVQYDPQFDHTTGVFATFPAVPGFWPGFVDQVVGTALLLGMILAVVDKLNALPGSNLGPFIIGLIIVAIGISFGGMNGYAINPARDMGPRLFALMMGFKNNGFFMADPATGQQVASIIWFVPVIGPIVGGLLGAFAYDLTIGAALVKAHQLSNDPEGRADGMDSTHREHEEVVNRVANKTL